MEKFVMNGYFFVLTTIDLFVLCFMCILTHLSESLSKKQKRGFFFGLSFDRRDFDIGSCYPCSGRLAVRLSLAEYCSQLSGIWSVTGSGDLSCVCPGQKNSLST